MALRRTHWIIASFLLILICPPSIWCGQSQLLYGAMVYIASSPDYPLGALLETEIHKRKLPVIISPDRQNANYVLAAYARTVGLPAVAVTGTQKSRTVWEARAVLADAQTRAIAWSADFRGPCPPCDASPSKAWQVFAAKFAKRLEQDLFERKSISDRIDDVLAP
ncbi:MAG: hypothetical protein WAM39_32230 [Bryobacteraceae bacterium]